MNSIVEKSNNNDYNRSVNYARRFDSCRKLNARRFVCLLMSQRVGLLRVNW